MRGAVKRAKYGLHHIIRALQDIVIPESQYLVTSRPEIIGPLGVIPGLLQMLAAINFDHEFTVQADEIRDIGA